MRFLPYILMILFALTTVTAVVTRPESSEAGPPLPERITQACKPWLVNDWWALEKDPGLLRVSCYEPKTGELRYTLVAR